MTRRERGNPWKRRPGQGTPAFFRLGAIALVVAAWPTPPAEGADGKRAADRVQAQAPRAPFSDLGYLPRFAFRKKGRWIQSSLRVESDGTTVRVSQKAFGSGGQPWGEPIPSHLGGGFLFLQPVASEGTSTTALFRSESWTGPLTPVGQVPFVVSEAEFGFDRVYLLGTSIQIGFDLESKRVLGLEPFPPLVTLNAMRFSGRQRALVSAPLVGVLYTNDAGHSWMRLAEAEDIVDSDREGLFVKVGREQVEVLPSGEFEPLVRDFSRAEKEWEEGVLPPDEPTPNEQARAVAQVVEQGALLGGSALALYQGRLYELQEKDGVSVRSEELAGRSFETCRGTSEVFPEESSSKAVASRPERKPSAMALFACDDTRGRLTVLSVKRSTSVASVPLTKKYTVQTVLSAQKRRLLVLDRGSLVVSGGCEDAAPSAVCLVRTSGRKTIALPKPSAPGAALAVDGSSLVRVVLDQKKKVIQVERFSGNRVLAKSYAFSPDEEEMLSWGSLLPQGSVIDGEVAVWLVHRERFVGLRLGDSKFPGAGAVQRPLSRAIFSGRSAFVWGAAGFAKQSVDGGLHFTETEVPFTSGDPQLASVIARRGAVRMGCSEVGCTLGRYVRFGWDPSFRLPVEQPQPVRIPPPGGGKLNFECGRGAFSSPPRLASSADDVPNFWEVAPPLAPEGDERFAVDFAEGYAVLYGFGPKDGPWGRQGRLQLFFVDPFVPDRVKRTASTLRLFPSATKAQEDLGILDRLTSASEIDFDPSGEGGVFLVRARDRAVVFSFVSGEPLVLHPSEPNLAWRGLSGAVLAEQQWYAGFAMGRKFTVARLGSLGIEIVAELPLGDASPRGASVVRTVAGDLGVAMEGDGGLVVYPLSTAGELGEPILVPHRSKRPPACDPQAQGFVVNREWSLTPYFAAPDESPLEFNDLRVRMIVGHGEPCLEGMSARSRSELPSTPPRRGPSAVPLGVLNHDSSRGRAQLLCE